MEGDRGRVDSRGLATVYVIWYDGGMTEQEKALVTRLNEWGHALSTMPGVQEFDLEDALANLRALQRIILAISMRRRNREQQPMVTIPS